MAKTKIAAPLAGIRGTVGGLTYSANGAGTYVKAWAPPTNPQSPNQMTERSYLAQMPALWNALTSGQRTAWDTFAALGAQALTDSLGQTYYITGFLWFVKCNIRLLRVGRTPITAAPVIARPSAPTIDDFVVTVAGSDPDLCSGGTANASSEVGGAEASKAFDNNPALYWSSGVVAGPWWIRYNLPSTKIVTGFSVHPYSLPGAYNMVDFTFQAWNGATWDTLYTRTGFAWPTSDPFTFWLDNSTTYTDYRIHCTQVTGPTQACAIREIQFFAGVEEASRITYPYNEFVTGGPWDLILHIAMTVSEAKIVQYPGHLEILATQTPGVLSVDLQSSLESPFGTILTGRRWFAKLFRQTTQGLRSAAQTAATNTV